MNVFLSKLSLRSRYWLALIAGLMLAAAFPKFSIAGFAWVAPGVILLCGIGKTGRQQFWMGYVAGLAHFLTSLYWLLFIPFPAGAIAAWLALSGYLAFYTAIWVWLCWKIFTKLTARCLVDNGDQNFSLGTIFLRTTWRQRTIWSLSCAVIWVALEMTMARVFGGFPWNFLGTTQYKLVPLIQIASITGVYGISFLLVWFSISLCSAGMLLVQRPQPSRAWSGEIILPALATAILFAVGYKPPDHEGSVPKLKVALVQPSIPQTLIFDPSQNETRFEKIIQLSENALAENPDVLIWPEASVPPLTEENFQTITNMIVSHHVWMIFGADDSETKETSDGQRRTNFYNSSFLFSPDGKMAATYRKQHLVGFGEYIPLERWLPFMKWFTPIEGGFTPGAGPVPFQIESPRAKTSVLICFEDAFPHYAREHVETDTDFLLNLTNDGWFGKSAAQWQQAVDALFRAVENGLPLVRCTNNGLTCWIDKRGRLRKIFQGESGDVYGPGFLLAEIPLLSPGEKRTPTFYQKHGDWFGWSCGAATLALALLVRRKSPIVT
ncbi:MAG: apolipoprotein N-acyltransferase [Verrucomicrobiota bacterium]